MNDFIDAIKKLISRLKALSPQKTISSTQYMEELKLIVKQME